MRIVLMANAEIRDNGTFCHVRDVFKRRLGLDPESVRHWHRGYDFPDTEHNDLVVAVDDGRDDLEMKVPPADVSAIWLIDTHLGFDVRLEWAKHFQHVFCAQKNGAERMREHGVEAHWLPLACNPIAHPNIQELMTLQQNLRGIAAQHPDEKQRTSAQDELRRIFMETDLSKMWDVVFVGYMNEGVEGNPKSHNRMDYLDKLYKAFPNSWLVTNAFHEQMAARFCKGRIGFHVSILDDLAMRPFEVMSTGTALLMNTDVVGIEDLGFEEGKHFVGYEGMDEMVEKARWMLENPEEREEIARAGHTLVRENHTYVHRILHMLQVCGIQIGGENAEATEQAQADAEGDGGEDQCVGAERECAGGEG